MEEIVRITQGTISHILDSALITSINFHNCIGKKSHHSYFIDVQLIVKESKWPNINQGHTEVTDEKKCGKSLKKAVLSPKASCRAGEDVRILNSQVFDQGLSLPKKKQLSSILSQV